MKGFYAAGHFKERLLSIWHETLLQGERVWVSEPEQTTEKSTGAVPFYFEPAKK